MKKILVSIMIIFAIVVVTLLGSFLYATHYKVAIVDAAQSVDGVYEVVLQAVGEPEFPFGSASGELVLKKNEMIVSIANIQIFNDGGPIGKRDWKVTWYDRYVEIILSGEEQYDELVVLYYDGQIERERLTTRGGIEREYADNSVAEDVTNTEDDLEYELFSGEQQINDGYMAIYELFSNDPIDNFEVYYGATESSSRCVLSENQNAIEYLVYNGRSENEKCGLYVHYRSEKNVDGTWSDTDIMDIYAYVYESGDVVSSGKTYWGDIGSEAYQKITGEK